MIKGTIARRMLINFGQMRILFDGFYLRP